ncbi:hypothetical protein BH11ARM1_BH11ARM1_04030 [soil metagenome]
MNDAPAIFPAPDDPAIRWMQTCRACGKVMLFDRAFYNPEKNTFMVEEWVAKFKAQFGDLDASSSGKPIQESAPTPKTKAKPGFSRLCLRRKMDLITSAGRLKCWAFWPIAVSCLGGHTSLVSVRFGTVKKP